ncbi:MULTISPECIES: hypothetical protein [unclassified Methylobacterium]|uniref:hypothetical protein n=1 Tax=unclassified Methylobacterium TaxID=2615210 RepID=UPI00165045D8|nr:MULTISPECIES: hypothetical protein [unclassified Methylobacterium]
MQYGADDPTAVAWVIHVGTAAIGVQDLLDHRLVIGTGLQGFQQTHQPQRGDIREVELALIPGPNLALCADASSGERIVGRKHRTRIQDEGRDRIAVSDMQRGPD